MQEAKVENGLTEKRLEKRGEQTTEGKRKFKWARRMFRNLSCIKKTIFSHFFLPLEQTLLGFDRFCSKTSFFFLKREKAEIFAQIFFSFMRPALNCSPISFFLNRCQDFGHKNIFCCCCVLLPSKERT